MSIIKSLTIRSIIFTYIIYILSIRSKSARATIFQYPCREIFSSSWHPLTGPISKCSFFWFLISFSLKTSCYHSYLDLIIIVVFIQCHTPNQVYIWVGDFFNYSRCFLYFYRSHTLTTSHSKDYIFGSCKSRLHKWIFYSSSSSFYSSIFTFSITYTK